MYYFYGGIAIGASSVVCYKVDVHYWECPLSEVPLYKKDGQRLIVTREWCVRVCQNIGGRGEGFSPLNLCGS